MRRTSVVAVVLMIGLSNAIADKAEPNEPYVVADSRGTCYAKAVPSGVSGEAGITRVYRVESGRDTLLHTFEWFTRRLFIACTPMYRSEADVSVVRLGEWPKGSQASAGTVALSIYRGDTLIKEFSTLEIAGKPDNVRRGAVHYEVFDDMLGFMWKSGRLAFQARRVDGQVVTIDMYSGKLTVEPPPPQLP